MLDPDDDQAYELVVAVAAGEVDDVTEIARRLPRWVAWPDETEPVSCVPFCGRRKGLS